MMKNAIKTKNLLQWVVVVFAISALMTACQSNGSNADESKVDNTAQVESMHDSLPPLKNDSTISDRPETMKSKTGGAQAQ